jgi:hypothetical protein
MDSKKVAYFNEECNVPNDCIVHRAYALPLVHATVDQVAETYSLAKKYSPALYSLLNGVEDSVKITAEKASPFYHKYLIGAVCVASKVACRGLDVIEHRYPSVATTTPDDIRHLVDVVYEKSGVKHKVNVVRDAKEATVAKVHNTVGYVRGNVLAIVNYAENMVDSYVGDDEPQTSKKFDYKKANIVTRVIRLPYRISVGTYYKSRRYWHDLQLIVIQAVKNIEDIINNTKQRAINAGNSAYENTEKLALRGLRSSIGVMALASDNVMTASEKLTSLTLSPLAASNAYLHKLENKAKNSSLSQMANESSEKIAEAGKVLVGAFNSALSNGKKKQKKL